METIVTVLKTSIKTTLFVLFLVVTALNSCSKDDEPKKQTEIINQAPEVFSLVSVADGSTAVVVKPEFSWNAAKDPDGDTVTYELFVDDNSNPITSIASSINETNFTLEERLPLNQELFWKVVASDSEGNTTSSDTFSFTTRNLHVSETPVTANAAFSARTNHTSVVFDDKMWVIGGYDGASRLNDVWQSADGKTWTQVTLEAPFHKRSGHTSVVFDNKIWIIGGFNGVDYLRDIWYSSDGENWTQTTGASPFPQNGLHSALVFRNNLWVIGSLDASAKMTNAIWKSEDGEIWSNVDSEMPFPERYDHSTLVFDDKMWIIGGVDYSDILNDIWQSSDGATWTSRAESSSLGKRSNHSAVTFDDKIWVIAGRDSKTRTKTIYQSPDGITWSEPITEIPFIQRTGHTTVVFNNKIWVIAGLGGAAASSYLNDVWVMD